MMRMLDNSGSDRIAGRCAFGHAVADILVFSSVFFVAALCGLSALHGLACAQEWDLSYLTNLDPAEVTATDLHERAAFVEENYQAHHSINGIIWKAYYADVDDTAPSLYGTGGDSAIFTGFYLAAAVYRFLITADRDDFETVFETLRGLHILTHVSGVPGVIARCAFPADQPETWRFPDAWHSRIEAGFVYESPDNIPDVGNPGACYPVFIVFMKTRACGAGSMKKSP